MAENFKDLAKELQGEFLIECSDLLSSLEANLIRYEQKKDQSTLNSALRDLHSIKGSSKAVGFETLSGFAHKLEDYISKNTKTINISFCLKAKDQMEIFIDTQKTQDNEKASQPMKLFKWQY